MKKFKYFVYDVLNISGEKQINIKEFEYDSTTLVYDFYKKLLEEYIVANEERLGIYKDLVDNISFNAIDIIENIRISNSTFELFFSELAELHNDKIYCIVPSLPIGEIMAQYRNYKIIIHSNENNHLRFPHVHIYDQVGQNAIASLIDFKISEGLYLKRKDEKKILEYLRENKEKLIDFYTQVIEHKTIEKVVIDKIL